MSSTPPYLLALKGEWGLMKTGWFKNYQANYINTTKFRPVIHVIGLIMTIGYIMEYPHLKRTHFRR